MEQAYLTAALMIGMSLRFLGFVCSSLRRIRSASKRHWFPSDIVAIRIGGGIEVAFRDETSSRDISRILRQTSSRSSYSVGPPSVTMEKTVLVNLYVNSRKVMALLATPIALAGSIGSTFTLNGKILQSMLVSVLKGDTPTNTSQCCKAG